jgi:hypothetical protein
MTLVIATWKIFKEKLQFLFPIKIEFEMQKVIIPASVKE